MSRTVMWIVVASVAAVLIIGGTVWFLRTRDVGGLPAFAPLTQSAVGNQDAQKSNQTLYDPPSKFVPASGKIEPAPPMPVINSTATQANVPEMIQLPSTMGE